MTTITLAVLLLLLVQTADGKGVVAGLNLAGLKYGDIIAFHRVDFYKKNFNITHFAIYVDKARFPSQKDGENLFHVTGELGRVPASFCTFGKISDEITTTAEVFNYLDAFTHKSDKIKIATETQITERITQTLAHCPTWLPTNQNCEHLATSIRYGVSVSLQFGKNPEGICRPLLWANKLDSKLEKEILKELHTIYDGYDDADYFTQLAIEESLKAKLLST